MLSPIAKAITALVVSLVALILGDEAVKGIDVGTVEAIVVAVLTALGVYAVPNTGAPNRVRRVP